MAKKTDPKGSSKPLKSRFFRVATEGATTDGRKIERAHIEQMAKNFDPEVYGARVWLEHMRGMYADSPFRAYGDVIAVEARDWKDGKRALFAQIKPLPELVAMNKAGQKIYTSIEITPEFSDTGEAYLTGLAVTDSPASLGTEALMFAAQNPAASMFAHRKGDRKDVLFSEAIEADLVFEEDDDDTDEGGTAAKFSSALQAVVGMFKTKGKTDDARFADVLKGFEQFAQLAQEQAEAHDTLQAEHKAMADKFNKLQADHTALVKQLEITPESGFTKRPAAAGGDGGIKTDC